MQEQFPARASTARIPKNEASRVLKYPACMPKMQEQFSARCVKAFMPKNEGTSFR